LKLYEYLAKEVFERYGIPVPSGRVAATPEEAAAVCAEVGGPVVVKSQILAGGRGKAGGIKFADDPAGAREEAAAILGSELKGHRVEQVLVEEKLRIDRELYLGIAVDGGSRRPLLIVSTQGGMDIEQVPEKQIVKRHLEVDRGFLPYIGREVAWRLGLEGKVAAGLVDIAGRLYRAFADCDAELVEINPLVVSGDRLIAADGRFNADDDALFRRPDLPRVEEGSALERSVKLLGLSFVELDGDIAVMANGAGITMATIDILKHYGGEAANFLDAGGGAGVEPTARAIEVLLATEPRAILINVFGGITRCDDVARAIVQVKQQQGIAVPLVTRLVGTNQAEGVSILNGAGIDAYEDIEEAARQAVALAQGGA